MTGKITRRELSSGLQAELNKTGRLDELTTLDKTNLVNAINEVDSKEVDLTPINNKIGELQEDLGSHLADNATIKHKAKEIELVDSKFIATNVEDGMNELFTNVSDGKQAVGTAVTDVDDSVVIPTEPSFADLAGAIGEISTGKKWASGTSNISSSSMSFATTSGSASNSYYITVNGLSFRPSIIIVCAPTNNGHYSPTTYRQQGISRNNSSGQAHNGNTGYVETGNLYINETGFRLPFPYITTALTWIAFE